MISVKPTYHFQRFNLELLKLAAALHLPEIPPSQRLEAVARGFGFATFAGLRTLAFEGPVGFCVDGAIGSQWLADKGHEADPSIFHYVASNYLVRSAMEQWKDLNSNGLAIYDPNTRRLCLWDPEEKCSPRNDSSFDGFRQKARADFSSSSEGALRAMALLSTIAKTKHIQRKYGSYKLKHIAENLEYRFEDGLKLEPSYVSNGDLISAALASGFDISHERFGSLNGFFNASLRSIRKAESMRIDRG